MDVSRIGTSQFKTSSPFDSITYSSAFQKNPVNILPVRIQTDELYKSPKSPIQDKSSSYESCGGIGKYKIIRAFSNKHTNPVYLAQIDGHKSDNDSSSSLRVIKTLDLNDQSFISEANILSLPSHPNIIGCKEILTSAAVELNFDIRIQNAIVLEHAANGDLFPYMECGALSESICRFYFEQMLNAIEYLHDNGYCHLDIKPENLLLDERFNMKLCDFGFAAQFEKNSKLVKTSCGTSGYFPPEAWKPAKGYDGTKADIFQLGIMLFIMLTGQPPFLRTKIEDGWFALVARGRWDEFWDFKENGITKVSSVEDKPIFSPAIRELLRAMFEPQPNMRATIQSIRKSKWFVETFPAESIEVQFEMLNRKAMKKI
eukprot:CAMPEP_0176456364 /NCGR_PEP_ID=MMETSP0127-20121128/31241_1 /TAXON_ID=938130 /ORGANISM="Platyophrya macrostoma, Strain WH" /LENGTH=371 /DNA_ID=CAMNT_0017846303 /DNA_START=65 /DNA_END=1180 /DNA_ORIENTATION=+